MKRISIRTWVYGVVVVALAASAGLTLHGCDMLSDSRKPSTAPRNEADNGLVCLGYVDVEGGVRRLGIGQAGRVTAVGVKEGGWIEYPEVPLVEIDDTVQRSQLAQAQEALAAEEGKRAQIDLQIQLRAKEKDLQDQTAKAAKDRVASAEKYYELRKSVVSPGQLKELEDGIRDLKALQKIEEGKIEIVGIQEKLAKSEGDQLEIAIRAKKEQVKQAEKAVAECRLLSPGPGRALKVNVHKGELVGPTSPLPLIEFSPDKPFIIRAEVHQEYASRVKADAACRIRDDGSSADTREWNGKIARISDWFAPRRSMLLEPLQFNDVRTIECIIELDPNQPPLRIGQRVRVIIGEVYKQP